MQHYIEEEYPYFKNHWINWNCFFTGGTGKTYLVKTALAYVRSQGGVALAMATSGIAGTLLPGGTTVHSKLRVPISLTDTSKCSYKENSGTADMIKKAKLIVIDEVTQGDRRLYETIDRSLRETRKIDKPFGGITTIFSGDWRQCLLVVKRGSRAQIMNRTFKKSKLWQYVKRYKLELNMRLKNISCPEEKDFHEWLLRVGDGREDTFPEIGEDMIKIPQKLKSKSKNLKEFCQEIFPGLSETIENTFKNHQEEPTILMDYLVKRAIISPANINNKDITAICTDMVRNQPMMMYRSLDKMLNPTKALNFPTEFLNKVTLSGMPDHIIVIKRGMPIMLLSNLDKRNGHANGSRYVVMDMTAKIIYALGIGETNRGKILLIPRIIFQPKDQDIPFEMERRQFPIKPCFAMTSNKSQGQNLDVVGLNLTQEFFTHGQTFTACSRATSSNGLKIFKPENSDHPNHMANVVYTELLD